MTPEEIQKFKDWGNALAETVRKLSYTVSQHENKINVLSNNLASAMSQLDGYKTLLVDLRGEEAVELHGSTGKSGFDLKEAKGLLQDPKNAGNENS